MTSNHHHSYKNDMFRNRGIYWKRVKNQLEQQELKSKSIHFRNKLLQDQQTMNYKLEYDGLRGILEHTVLPQQTKANVEARQIQLKSFIIA